VTVLAAIVVLLAVLQYRWSGEISRAERETLSENLNLTVRQFRQEFYRTLLDAAVAFPSDASAGDEQQRKDWIESQQKWSHTAVHPELIAAVYTWRTDGRGASPLSRLDTQKKQFEPVDWPQTLDELRQRLDQNPPMLPRRANGSPAPVAWTFEEQIPGLVLPITPVTGGSAGRSAPREYLVLALNLGFVQKQLLPDLAQRYFGGPDGLIYEAAVVNDPDSETAIYRSDPKQPIHGVAQGPLPAISSPDLVVYLLQARPVDAIRSAGGQGQTNSARRESELWPKPLFGRPSDADLNGGKPASSIILPGSNGRLWQLQVKLRSGSLDAAVAASQRRNLGIGFGILVLLAASITMIVVSARRAQRLAEMQMEFVAGISHELRTPLAVICSAADNLSDGVVGAKEQVRLYGNLIRGEGHRLSSMVEQILLFASGQAGSMHYEVSPLDLVALLHSILGNMSSAIAEGGFTLEQKLDPALPPVLGNEDAIRQCLQNLISNAMKYGGDDRWLRVVAESAETPSGLGVQVTVEDRGVGIEPTDLELVFEPFYRSKTVRGAQIRGSGLGLSLARDVVHAIGGQLTVESTPGKGSAFTLHLPAAKQGVREMTEAR